jgi:hypothetical protein
MEEIAKYLHTFGTDTFLKIVSKSSIWGHTHDFTVEYHDGQLIITFKTFECREREYDCLNDKKTNTCEFCESPSFVIDISVPTTTYRPRSVSTKIHRIHWCVHQPFSFEIYDLDDVLKTIWNALNDHEEYLEWCKIRSPNWYMPFVWAKESPG